MVLGDVIGVEARALVRLDNFEPLAVIARERTVILVQVIEDAEFHGDGSNLENAPCLVNGARRSLTGTYG